MPAIRHKLKAEAVDIFDLKDEFLTAIPKTMDVLERYDKNWRYNGHNYGVLLINVLQSTVGDITLFNVRIFKRRKTKQRYNLSSSRYVVNSVCLKKGSIPTMPEHYTVITQHTRHFTIYFVPFDEIDAYSESPRKTKYKETENWKLIKPEDTVVSFDDWESMVTTGEHREQDGPAYFGTNKRYHITTDALRSFKLLEDIPNKYSCVVIPKH